MVLNCGITEEKFPLFRAQIDGKPCRWVSQTLLSCFHEFTYCSLALRASVMKRVLLELNSDGGEDPLGALPLLYKNFANALALK